MSLLHHDARHEAFDFTSHFREDLYTCLTRRGDTPFELCDVMLCEDGPVTSPVDLTLLAEHRRGHGALYDALNQGRINVDRLRKALAMLPQPKPADGRLVLAVDVSAWLRPDASTSPDRLFCHVYGRSGRSSDQFIPGWPYSFVAALETGRTSWCQLLDAVRLGPDDDIAEVTAAQVRRVVTDLIDQGQWEVGDPDIPVVFDAGYDAPRMAFLLEGLSVEVLGRMRSDRVMRRPTPTLKKYALAYPQGGRPPKHGKEFRFAKPDTWGEADVETVQVTDRYGTACAMAWDRIHPRLTTRSAWLGHDGELPVIEGTLIRPLAPHRGSKSGPADRPSQARGPDTQHPPGLRRHLRSPQDHGRTPRRGWPGGHKRVARIMWTIGLEGVRLRRRHRTTVADQAAAKAPDLIGRDFTAAEVNTKYVGDIIYLPVSGAKPLYLATVIDLATRRLAGWAIADHMRTELVIDALAAAGRTRGSLTGAMIHTDHGSPYTSRAFAEICRSAGVRQSMGAIGSSADNAAAESFNAAFKRETLKGRKAWSSEREAQAHAFRWLTPIQHPTQALPPRSAIPDRLRERPPTSSNHPGPSRMDVFRIRGQGPTDFQGP